jgi:hypothetical protein
LPNSQEQLGVPLFETLGTRTKRKSEVWRRQMTSQEDHWDLWTSHSGTDGSWGYWTPIYMLNWIIRLQAVVKNYHQPDWFCRITEKTQMHVAMYQNRLALDYHLAEEGGVCGKFNHSDCCL